MKHFILLILVLVFFRFEAIGQGFFNGDFENNTATACDYNLTDDQFNTKVPNVTAFGKSLAIFGNVGEIDLQTHNCLLNPQNGDWCLGLSSDMDTTSDAIAILLASDLVAGQSYSLSFYLYGNTNNLSTLTNIEVGESLSDTLFGTFIDSIAPDTNAWKQASMIFTASQNSRYITVRTKIASPGWTQIDNFTLTPLTTTPAANIDSHFELSLYPNPANDVLNLDFGSSAIEGVISIMNPMGQIIATQKVHRSQSVSLDVSAIPAGVYLIGVESEQGSTQGPFIKN